MRFDAEWLEADGLGGFAMGTVGGWRSRRYHGLLGVALTPPTGRHVLVNGFDAFVERGARGDAPIERIALSTQCWRDGHLAPDGWTRLAAFAHAPWPTWTFDLGDSARIVQEIVAIREAPVVVVRWRVDRTASTRSGGARRNGDGVLRLVVRPFLSGRDHHALHQENGAIRFAPIGDDDARARDSRLIFRPYDALPTVASLANATWRDDPLWYRDFHYAEESARGLDAAESLAAPGELVFDLARGDATWIVGAEMSIARAAAPGAADLEIERFSLLEQRGAVASIARRLLAREASRRDRLASAFAASAAGRAVASLPIERHDDEHESPSTAFARAADAFLVRRGAGRSLLAGVPWFTDWGRDACIAARGLLIASGRLAEARDLLLEWSRALDGGLLPNRFPDRGAPAEFGAADGALWLVVAIEELLAADARAVASGARRSVSRSVERALLAAVASIVAAYERGTGHGIAMAPDTLLAVGDRRELADAGVPAPTWMDARVDGRLVTPRVGKPVELQALWWNALSFAATKSPNGARFAALAQRVRNAFLDRFWNGAASALLDVVDVDHEPGRVDASFRPNQLLAIGGLPRQLLVGPRARAVVDAVEARLLAPCGVRTLAPDDPRFVARFEGGATRRDAAYHQGSAWPWLLGPFAEAWARVRGDTKAARREACQRFVAPLLADALARGGHVGELTHGRDDAPPPAARWLGCPTQAWSLGELLRVAAAAPGESRSRRSSGRTRSLRRPA